MTEFQTATPAVEVAALAIQQTALAAWEAELEVSRSATRVGIEQIAAGVLQTLVIASGLLFMRSESQAPARRHEEIMFTLGGATAAAGSPGPPCRRC